MKYNERDNILSTTKNYLACGLVLATLLTGCAINPMGNSLNWKELGESGDTNIQYAIDMSSIQRHGELVTFRDRKKVIDMSRQQFHHTPPFKYALGSWEVNCQHKTFRLIEVKLMDERGQVVNQAQYTMSDIRPMMIMRGSAAEQQYNQVCQHSF